jgi:type II secretory pathway pseudopilin PulG
MKAVTSQILGLLKGTKGVATSLIEATATVAVGAVLAGVAVGSAIDAINDSKIQAALADFQVIGQGLITFYKDNSFFPLFKVGNATGPGDEFFNNLVSENGTYPTVDSSIAGAWSLSGEVNYADGALLFGHQVLATDDSIEAQLLTNLINRTSADSGVNFTGDDSYPDRGTIAGDPQRGWSGPYVATLSSTDPWGNKYLINVRKLHVKHFQELGSTEVLPNIGVVVISAGPNRALETSDAQTGETFSVNGDDIVFRIK